MNKNIFGMIGLSGLLLLGSVPGVVLAHEGHDHGEGRSGYSEREGSRRYEPPREEERSRYRREQEESGRYAPQREDDRWNNDAYDRDEDEEDETYRPSARRYPPPDQEQSAPREWGSRSR
ncbi:MAG TPA: hypothetical protein VGX03_12705 [Candidatus Binatia bacterium]|jgi:hypothetical protein|nr:hypothetical protein [Candidatus Binatia bacterium]